jgi:hypothetical protein
MPSLGETRRQLQQNWQKVERQTGAGIFRSKFFDSSDAKKTVGRI